MKPLFGLFMEFLGWFLKKYNRVHILDVTVMKTLPFLPSYPFVLPEKMIRRVAGTALSWKCIADFLDFNICQAFVLQFNNNIRIKQCRLCPQPDRIIRQNCFDMYIPVKQKWQKFLQTLRRGLRIKDFLKYAIIEHLYPPYTWTIIQKHLLVSLTPSLKQTL